MSLPAKMTKNQVSASVCVYYILYILKNCCGIFCEKVRISGFLDSHSAVMCHIQICIAYVLFFYKCRPTICHVVHESGLRSLLMHSKLSNFLGEHAPGLLKVCCGFHLLIDPKIASAWDKKNFLRGFHYSLIRVIQRPCLNLGFYPMQ